MKKAQSSKSEFLCWAFNLYTSFKYCLSESKCVKECQNSARQFFSKYRVVVLPERINDYIYNYFLQSIYL